MHSFRSGFILLVTGTAVVLSAASIDLIHARNNDFGLQQLSVLIVGLIVALEGFRQVVYPKHKFLAGALSAVYIAGILYLGLKPPNLDTHGLVMNGILGTEVFSGSDFAINVFGFIPVSYLLMSCFDNQSEERTKNREIILALCIGFGISLFLESAQAYIPGRFSSSYDLLANGLGTLVGISFYLTRYLLDSKGKRAQYR